MRPAHLNDPETIGRIEWSTRGMRKNRVSRAKQIANGERADDQRHREHRGRCIHCEGPRDSTYPVCTNCERKAA